MERKKLVYNAINDLWKIAGNDFANKSIVDMTDEDWQELVDHIEDASEKYKNLRPEEEAFFSDICNSFMSLIEREIKTETTVPIEYPPATGTIWLDKKSAKERYDIDLP